MVDSREKGARAEADLVKKLSDHTGLNFKRIPMSGALDASHGLKGDVYIPNSLNIYCIEVKHYKDDHFTSKILTDKTPQLLDWWGQTVREAAQVSSAVLRLINTGNIQSDRALQKVFPLPHKHLETIPPA